MPEPQATYLEDEYRFLWESAGVELVFERFREERGELKAEVQPHNALGPGVLPPEKLNLGSARSIKQYANTLSARGLLESEEWVGMLTQACGLAVARYRDGAPAVDLWAEESGPAGRYLVKPFVFDNAVNLLYGAGDSGKSALSLVLGLVVASGEEIAGLVTERQGNVMYLDWEDSDDTHRERVRALARGFGIEGQEGWFKYRRMDASLRESTRAIRKDIATYNVALVIIDSIGMACGGDPNDAGGIIQAMLAARSLGVPVLAIHHLAKEAKDKSTPYGSVYASNEARMSWLVESERELDGALRMSLTNYKSNRGARHDRQAFSFRFVEDDYERIERIEVTSLTFAQVKDVGKGGQKYKIADALKRGAMTVGEIAEATGITTATVRMWLNRSKDELFVKLPDGKRWGVSGYVSEHISDTRTVSYQGGPFRDPDTSDTPLVVEGEEGPDW